MSWIISRSVMRSVLGGARFAVARWFERATVLAWRQVRQPIERRCQVALRGKPAVERDVGDRHLGVDQELLRSFDASSEHVLVRREAGAPLERSDEEMDAHLQLLGELLQREVLVDVLVDVLLDPAQL